MTKLEFMQKEFKEWLKKKENTINKDEINYYRLIEKKIFEIASKNGYEYIAKIDDLEPCDVFLMFRNKKNRKFINAFTNEIGFSKEEYDHID